MDQREVDLAHIRLKNLFFRHPQHDVLTEQFDLLLRRRRLELDHGIVSEMQGIVLVGGSGSGKSTSLRHMFKSYPGHVCGRPGQLSAEIVDIELRGQGGLKGAGTATLYKLGRPVRGEKPSWVIWDLVRDELRKRGTLFLHIGEAQHIVKRRNPREEQEVIDTFKSLMQDGEWPVGLILSGMPSFKRLVNADPQLARRMYAIEYSPISSISDHEMITDVVSSYAAKASLQVGPELSRRDFIPRLIHAGASQFGLIVQRVVMSIDEALRNDDPALGWQHFAWEFRRKTKCIDAFNPFISEDYLAIDTRRLLRPDEEDPF